MLLLHVILVCLGMIFAATSTAAEEAEPTGPSSLTPGQIAACASNEQLMKAIVEGYWAKGTFGSSDPERQAWYSSHLCAAGEIPLRRAVGSHAYGIRLLWLRTFHPTVVVRVQRDPGGIHLVAAKLSGAGGYAPGGVKERVDEWLPEDAWKTLDRTLEKSSFWQLPTTLSESGMDGSQWIVEVVQGDRYHVVDRWGGGELKGIGTYLLELSKLRVGRMY